MKSLSFICTKSSSNLSNIFKDKIEVYLGRRQSRQAKEETSIHTVKFSANKCLIKKKRQSRSMESDSIKCYIKTHTPTISY